MSIIIILLLGQLPPWGHYARLKIGTHEKHIIMCNLYIIRYYWSSNISLQMDEEDHRCSDWQWGAQQRWPAKRYGEMGIWPLLKPLHHDEHLRWPTGNHCIDVQHSFMKQYFWKNLKIYTLIRKYFFCRTNNSIYYNICRYIEEKT